MLRNRRGGIDSKSPFKQTEEKTTKPQKIRITKTGKHEMYTGTKTNPVTGKKTSQYQAY